MATEHRHEENIPVERSQGYERRDAYVPGLLQFAFWMAVVLAITLVGMRWTYSYFKRTSPLGETTSPMVKPTDRIIPPAPLLQAHPHQELVDFCSAQQKEVTTYGWVNQQGGIVRIPIDRAMDLIATRGLPARSAAETPANAPMVAPATVAGGQDLYGQCGYLTEPPPDAPVSEAKEEK
jgi:hypothetical protein